MVRPKFNEAMFPEAYVREGVTEWMLRAGEAGMLRAFIDTTNMGDSGWGSLLVDEDWHAACQAIFMGVEQAESANLYCKFVEKEERDQCPQSRREQQVEDASEHARTSRSSSTGMWFGRSCGSSTCRVPS